MSIIALPTEFRPRSCTLVSYVSQRVNASPFGGSEQAIDLLNDRWMLSCELPAKRFSNSAQLEAFIGAMRGQTNTVNLWHFARPIVSGTIAGTKTLSASAAQGASSISITATGTLIAGDMIGVGGFLLMVAADATSSAGIITATLANRLRTSIISGSPVTTTKPTAAFRLMATSGVQYVPGYAQPISFDFGEAI